MATQTINGKAFEYALLNATFTALKSTTKVVIKEDDSFQMVKSCFHQIDEKDQIAFNKSATKAIEFILAIEPRLKSAIAENDILELEIASDARGQSGDVRDVIMIRNHQKWEIGISAKNNHKAVKHSRLSNHIDFGDKWFGKNCSKDYFDEIKPIFDRLSEIRTEDPNSLWADIPNMHDTVYVPILIAFRKELLRLDAEHPKEVAEKLIKYLVGTEDFYKVIRSKREVEIQAYNIDGSLNLNSKEEKAHHKVNKIKLPSRMIEVVFQRDSKTTLIVSLDEGWQISFRIHNASSRVEPSLKFDINLVSAPQSLFTTHLFT